MKEENLLNKKVNILELKRNYMDSISDGDFKKYLEKNKINEDIACKYLSRLQDCFNDIKNCSNCRKLSECKNENVGYRLVPRKNNNIIEFDFKSCDYLDKKEKDDEFKSNIKLYQMPRYVYNASFKDIYKDDKNRLPVIKYFNEFYKSYLKNKDNLLDSSIKGLYLNGSFGSGKTYLISCLFNELAKKNIKSCVVYFPSFLVDLRGSFSDYSFSDKFNYIKNMPLLLLDDIGAENVSNWSRDDILGPLLQYRMENKLPTFFTSNLTLDQLEKNLSITQNGVDKVKARRIIERIKQLTINIELVSENRRK